MIKISAAFHQLISVTCDKAKKYSGDKKIENGIRNSLIVDAEIIDYSMFSVS
jgi:hypothetical protein